jgi:hypothetical protein
MRHRKKISAAEADRRAAVIARTHQLLDEIGRELRAKESRQRGPRAAGKEGA